KSDLRLLPYSSCWWVRCKRSGGGRRVGTTALATVDFEYLQPCEAGMAKWLLVVQILCAASAWSQIPALGSVEEKRLGAISETDQQIRTLQDRVKQAPGDFAEYDSLGFAFFQKARETGDI